MNYCENEIKSMIELAIKANESNYLFNKQKAENGLNQLMILLNEYQETIRLLIESNREKTIIKDVN